MIIWRLKYEAFDEVCTQHFLSRKAALDLLGEIPDIQAPEVEGIYISPRKGLGSKRRALRWLNQQERQTARPQT
ncbi:MAG: hypothetical protein EOM91_23580 [Sphingobacteriia bacterium]|nr:hypothetical protein [Sphingobacteriia bacterium]